MVVKLLRDFDWNINDKKYSEGDIVKVSGVYDTIDMYVRYFTLECGQPTLDYIPKDYVAIMVNGG